eukprot:m.1259100 g.1259100  ORF g.1259100 m.1259100 type:complete len:330 (-) comp24725_c0_seq6:2220-3209(-)
MQRTVRSRFPSVAQPRIRSVRALSHVAAVVRVQGWRGLYAWGRVRHHQRRGTKCHQYHRWILHANDRVRWPSSSRLCVERRPRLRRARVCWRSDIRLHRHRLRCPQHGGRTLRCRGSEWLSGLSAVAPAAWAVQRQGLLQSHMRSVRRRARVLGGRRLVDQRRLGGSRRVRTQYARQCTTFGRKHACSLLPLVDPGLSAPSAVHLHCKKANCLVNATAFVFPDCDAITAPVCPPHEAAHRHTHAYSNILPDIYAQSPPHRHTHAPTKRPADTAPVGVAHHGTHKCTQPHAYHGGAHIRSRAPDANAHAAANATANTAPHRAAHACRSGG